jgi:hypothetical protein
MGAVRTKELLITEVAEVRRLAEEKKKHVKVPPSVGARSSGKSTWTSPTKSIAG